MFDVLAVGGRSDVLHDQAPAGLHEWLQPQFTPNGDPVQVPAELARAVHEHVTHECELDDMLATIYERLVAGPNRRHLGTFFTPEPVVDHMVDMCNRLLAETPSEIIDPGAGVGAFTMAVPATWPSARVRAVDVNAVTLGLLLVRQALNGQLSSVGNTSTGRRTHELTDFLSWLSELPASDGPRLFLGNPPYTRVHDMAPELRTSAFELAGDLVQSRLAGLSTYFVATMMRHLRPSDSLCLLIPGNWSYANYGRELRRWVWSNANRRVVMEYFPVEAEVFPGTRVTAMILFVGPQKQAKQPLTIGTVRLDKAAERVIVVAKSNSNRADLLPARFAPNDATGVRPPSRQSIRLSDVVTTRRGIATGANHFFFVDDAAAERLGRQFFIPALTRAAHVEGDELTTELHADMVSAGRPAWLLRLPPQAPSAKRVVDYLRQGETDGIADRYLARVRKQWWSVEEIDPPDLIFTPFSRGLYRVIVNSAAAVPSNNLYGLYLREGTPWSAPQLGRFLSSEDGRVALRQVARQYQGGSYKLEPREMLNAVIPSKPPAQED